MNKQNFIRITFFVSVLVFNPVVADTLRVATDIRTNISVSITEDIASILYKRGLEQEAAKQRAEEFIKGDARLFSLMLDNLINGCNDISKEEMLEYLSTAALFKQNIAMDSYAQLIDIYSKIKRSPPEQKVRERLSAVAKRNALMFA